MAYIGVSPSNGVRRVHTYTATASQTTFSGAGAEGTSLSYKDSNFVDVYQNGIKLGDADYTSTSGTSIVLAQAASVDDLVVVVVFDVFSVADTVSKADGGTFDGNVTMAGTLGVTGAVTANAGVNIDNITIDGTEIDLSSGDLTLDVAGDIILDADGSDIIFKDGGTDYGRIKQSSSDLIIRAGVQDKDIKLQGDDGGVAITALQLDMSDGGAATFAKGITLTNGNLAVASGNGIDFSATQDGPQNSPTTDSELFDDYEEGQWTPSVDGANSTYGNRIGWYTKIGEIVQVFFNVSVNSFGGSVRYLLGGLPYTSKNTTASGSGSVTFFSNIHTNATVLTTRVDANNSSIYFSGMTTSATSQTVNHNVFKDGTAVFGFVIYRAT